MSSCRGDDASQSRSATEGRSNQYRPTVATAPSQTVNHAFEKFIPATNRGLETLSVKCPFTMTAT